MAPTGELPELTAAIAELAVDTLLAIDDRHFYVRGRIDNRPAITALRAISPEGTGVDLLPLAHRFTYRGQGESPGVEAFVAYFELSRPSRQRSGWAFTAEYGRHTPPVIATAPTATDAVATVQRALLGEVVVDSPGTDALLVNHLVPALSRLQERRGEPEVERVTRFGEPPRHPQTSIIVPLYRRIDFLYHQLAQFALDPDLHHAELTYVLDSPELGDGFLPKAAALFELYQVPFKVIILSHNAGYAGANRVAAAIARGRRILLLNSDVLPRQPGWLARMEAFYDATVGIGALGPKLLYEDESIQHAGLYFRRRPGSEIWRGSHCFEGLHHSFPDANRSRPVPAICGACLLIDRDLYEAVGGLPTIYLHGGYEDSHLCLRLLGEGLRNWYLADVELYHLSGQSYDLATRIPATNYNAWLHTRLWNDQIETVMRGFSPGTAP